MLAKPPVVEECCAAGSEHPSYLNPLSALGMQIQFIRAGWWKLGLFDNADRSGLFSVNGNLWLTVPNIWGYDHIFGTAEALAQEHNRLNVLSTKLFFIILPMINNCSKSSYMRCVNFGVKLARWIMVKRRLRKCMLNGLVRKLFSIRG